MRIVSIGGGPAGLYFAILMRKAFPQVEVRVVERNRPDDTFGWGVVFSDETLGNFLDADAATHERIERNFKYWQSIETFYRGTKTVSVGHGFAALSRRKLLLILQERARELGVELEFEREVTSLEPFADADLVLGADGVNSFVRTELADAFGPELDWRRCHFSWLGTDLPLDAFTFVFEESDDGLFQVHAYPFEDGLATWIVECHPETFRRSGLDEASEEETVAYCEELFAPYLDGHRLLSNRSIWRRFPTVSCATWHAVERDGPPVVLLGDAGHTAHFSIGSGTKLAMEDAISLVAAFRRHGLDDVPRVLAAYQDDRWVDVIKLQKAAQTSLEWFENSERYIGQHPLQFTFNLMTRSKRITYENLKERDPQLVARVEEWYRREVGAPKTSEGKAPPPIFTPVRFRDVELANRVVVSPMCQYSAEEGCPTDWHLVHLGSRAIGGAGLVITEMTDVSAAGRITHGCAGMYAREHVEAWRRIVDFVHANAKAKIGMQLAHAGRKGSVRHPWEGEDIPLGAGEGAWKTLAPSALPFRPDWPAPRAMDRDDMDRVLGEFVRAARYAEDAGFDWLEVHFAHGYLLSSFLSPLANRREDEYGGSLDNRMRYPLEVFEAMRAAWPEQKPMSVRISATDWMEEEERGMTVDDSVELSRRLKALGCDAIDVSSAGNSPESEPVFGRMYQVPFADRIRHEVGIPVMAVGAILGEDHANTILAAGRADLAVMARPHLRRPYLSLEAAARYGYPDVHWPGQYVLGKWPEEKKEEE